MARAGPAGPGPRVKNRQQAVVGCLAGGSGRCGGDRTRRREAPCKCSKRGGDYHHAARERSLGAITAPARKRPAQHRRKVSHGPRLHEVLTLQPRDEPLARRENPRLSTFGHTHDLLSRTGRRLFFATRHTGTRPGATDWKEGNCTIWVASGDDGVKCPDRQISWLTKSSE